MEDVAIACSLDRDDLQTRLSAMRAVGSDGLEAVERDGHTVTLRFRAGDAIAGRLREIQRAEQHCCPFLEIDLDEGAEGTALSITAPADAMPVADDLAVAFGARPVSGRSIALYGPR